MGGEGLFDFRVVDADTLFDFRVVTAVTLFDDFIGVFRLAHADVLFLGRNLLDLYVRCLDVDGFVFLPTELDISIYIIYRNKRHQGKYSVNKTI